MSIATNYRVDIGGRVDLSKWKTDDAEGVERAAVEAKAEENAMIIADLQHKLYAQHERSVLIVLQAMDAAGKDSTIRRVFGRMNPQGVQMKSFKRPTEDAINRCNTEHARWHIVPTDCEWYRVWVGSKIVLAMLEEIGPSFLKPKLDPMAAMRLA